MASRYIFNAEADTFENRFSLPPQEVSLQASYNIVPGCLAPVLTDAQPYQIQLFRFGFTPFWAKTDLQIPTARCEGDSNMQDNPAFRGAMGIIQKKAFRKAIRSQRCVVLASAFIEGAGSFQKLTPHVIYLRKQQNPFPMAGIWDSWLNPETGKPINTFCIITTTANSLMRKLGFSRMPVILSVSQAKKWVNQATELTNITRMLCRYESSLMNAYPIGPAIHNSTANDKSLIKPVGARVLEEDDSVIRQPQRISYGFSSHKRRNADEPRITLGERAERARQEEEKAAALKPKPNYS